MFTGIIDGLFENGFLITVDINNVVFKYVRTLANKLICLLT